MHTAEVPVLYNTSNQKRSFVRDVRELVQFAPLLANLVQRDLTVRYKRSVLGFFWTMLNPLLLMTILTIVFSTIFRFAVVHYETYFLSAYLVFGFFSQTTVTSMTSLGWNGYLMKRVRVPMTIFPVSITISGLVNLCLACIPLLLIMLVVGAPIRPAMLFLPVAFLIIGVFTLGVSLGLSAMAVYFDDVSQMYQVATIGLMYLTPIIYPMEIIPEEWRWLIEANPLTQLFRLARVPIYEGSLPSLELLGVSVLLAVLSLAIGWSIFSRLSPGFYRHL